MLHDKTKKQLEEVYNNNKPYLNNKNCCEELHSMCMNCENFCGIEKHDYSGCREMPCFVNWLGLAYLNWANGY